MNDQTLMDMMKELWPKTPEERIQIQAGIDIANICNKILTLDLDKISEKIEMYFTVEPLINPTRYIKYQKQVRQLRERVRILRSTQIALQELKK